MQRISNMFRGLIMPVPANQNAGKRSLKGIGIVGIGLVGLFLIVVGCAENRNNGGNDGNNGGGTTNVTLALDTTSDVITGSAALTTPSLDDANAYRIEIIDKRGSGTLSMKAQTSGGVDLTNDELSAPSALTSGNGAILFPTGQRLFLPGSDASYKLVATASGNVSYKVRLSVYAPTLTTTISSTNLSTTVRRTPMDAYYDGTNITGSNPIGSEVWYVAHISNPIRYARGRHSSFPNSPSNFQAFIGIYDSDDFERQSVTALLINSTSSSKSTNSSTSRVVFINVYRGDVGTNVIQRLGGNYVLAGTAQLVQD